MVPEIAPLSELPADFDDLVAVSLSEEFGALRRMRLDWDSGVNRFDRPGEIVLEARLGGRLVGICGLNRDPYAVTSEIGRLRRLYVHPKFRRLGIARQLTAQILDGARGTFTIVRLRTLRDDADQFYMALGFRRVAGDPEATHEVDVA